MTEPVSRESAPSESALSESALPESTLPEPAVFVLADRALDAVVAQISDEQWEMPMPPTFAIGQTSERPSLRQVVNYHAYDDAWVPDMLAGRTMEESGRDQFDGDLLGEAPAASFAAIVEKACAAASEVRDLEQIAHL